MWTGTLNPSVLQTPQIRIPNNTPTRELPVHSYHFDWGFIDSVDPFLLKSEQDTRTMKSLALDLSQAPNLPLENPQRAQRVFQVAQVLIESFYRSNEKSVTTIREQRKEIQGLKKLLSQFEAQPKEIIGVKCPCCLKAFQSMDYLDVHISSKHGQLGGLWRVLRQPQSMLVTSNIEAPQAKPQAEYDVPSILRQFRSEMQIEQQLTEQKMLNLISQKMTNFETKFDELQTTLRREETLAQTVPARERSTRDYSSEFSGTSPPFARSKHEERHHKRARSQARKEIVETRKRRDLRRRKEDNESSDFIFAFDDPMDEAQYETVSGGGKEKADWSSESDISSTVVKDDMNKTERKPMKREIEKKADGVLDHGSPRAEPANRPKLELQLQNTTEVFNILQPEVTQTVVIEEKEEEKETLKLEIGLNGMTLDIPLSEDEQDKSKTHLELSESTGFVSGKLEASSSVESEKPHKHEEKEKKETTQKTPRRRPEDSTDSKPSRRSSSTRRSKTRDSGSRRESSRLESDNSDMDSQRNSKRSSSTSKHERHSSKRVFKDDSDLDTSLSEWKGRDKKGSDARRGRGHDSSSRFSSSSRKSTPKRRIPSDYDYYEAEESYLSESADSSERMSTSDSNSARKLRSSVGKRGKQKHEASAIESSDVKETPRRKPLRSEGRRGKEKKRFEDDNEDLGRDESESVTKTKRRSQREQLSSSKSERSQKPSESDQELKPKTGGSKSRKERQKEETGQKRSSEQESSQIPSSGVENVPKKGSKKRFLELSPPPSPPTPPTGEKKGSPFRRDQLMKEQRNRADEEEKSPHQEKVEAQKSNLSPSRFVSESPERMKTSQDDLGSEYSSAARKEKPISPARETSKQSSPAKETKPESEKQTPIPEKKEIIKAEPSPSKEDKVTKSPEKSVKPASPVRNDPFPSSPLAQSDSQTRPSKTPEKTEAVAQPVIEAVESSESSGDSPTKSEKQESGEVVEQNKNEQNFEIHKTASSDSVVETEVKLTQQEQEQDIFSQFDMSSSVGPSKTSLQSPSNEKHESSNEDPKITTLTSDKESPQDETKNETASSPEVKNKERPSPLIIPESDEEENLPVTQVKAVTSGSGWMGGQAGGMDYETDDMSMEDILIQAEKEAMLENKTPAKETSDEDPPFSPGLRESESAATPQGQRRSFMSSSDLLMRSDDIISEESDDRMTNNKERVRDEISSTELLEKQAEDEEPQPKDKVETNEYKDSEKEEPEVKEAQKEEETKGESETKNEGGEDLQKESEVEEVPAENENEFPAEEEEDKVDKKDVESEPEVKDIHEETDNKDLQKEPEVEHVDEPKDLDKEHKEDVDEVHHEEETNSKLDVNKPSKVSNEEDLQPESSPLIQEQEVQETQKHVRRGSLLTQDTLQKSIVPGLSPQSSLTRFATSNNQPEPGTTNTPDIPNADEEKLISDDPSDVHDFFSHQALAPEPTQNATPVKVEEKKEERKSLLEAPMHIERAQKIDFRHEVICEDDDEDDSPNLPLTAQKNMGRLGESSTESSDENANPLDRALSAHLKRQASGNLSLSASRELDNQPLFDEPEDEDPDRQTGIPLAKTRGMSAAKDMFGMGRPMEDARSIVSQAIPKSSGSRIGSILGSSQTQPVEERRGIARANPLSSDQFQKTSWQDENPSRPQNDGFVGIPRSKPIDRSSVRQIFAQIREESESLNQQKEARGGGIPLGATHEIAAAPAFRDIRSGLGVSIDNQRENQSRITPQGQFGLRPAAFAPYEESGIEKSMKQLPEPVFGRQLYGGTQETDTGSGWKLQDARKSEFTISNAMGSSYGPKTNLEESQRNKKQGEGFYGNVNSCMNAQADSPFSSAERFGPPPAKKSSGFQVVHANGSSRKQEPIAVQEQPQRKKIQPSPAMPLSLANESGFGWNQFKNFGEFKEDEETEQPAVAPRQSSGFTVQYGVSRPHDGGTFPR